VEKRFHPGQVTAAAVIKKLSKCNHEFIVIATDTAGNPNQFILARSFFYQSEV
jgi:hypothetical protein